MAARPVMEVEPEQFLSMARQFYTASERVFDEQTVWNVPLYFLYFHILELCFKAFLRSHNISTSKLKGKKGHELGILYEDCRGRGLVIGPDDRTDIANVVNFLVKANEDQGLRYFNPNIKSMPTLAWTREVVQKVIKAIEKRLGLTGNEAPGPATRLAMVISKPQTK